MSNTIVAKPNLQGVCTADYCPDQPEQSELRVESMADCFAFLGDLTPSYLCQHRTLPEVASPSRHCDIDPHSWLLRFRYRALVRDPGPTPAKPRPK